MWFGFGICQQKPVEPDTGDQIEENSISTSGECYACTQAGLPVFHSTSCDRAHQPEWEASAGSSLLPIKTGRKPAVHSRPDRRVCWTRGASACEVEQSIPPGAWHGADGGSSVLQRAVDRPRRLAVPVHGRRSGGVRDGDQHVPGRGSLVPPVASVSIGVCVERIAGCRVWEARVGCTRHCFSLSAVSERVLVRCVCYSARTSEISVKPLEIKAKGNPRTESAKILNRRQRKKFNGTAIRPRLSVFCSDKQLYAMLIDDQSKKCLFYGSTLQKSIRKDQSFSTVEAAEFVGEELIKTCIDLNINEISSYDHNGLARGERMRAFEIPIRRHGFLSR